MLASERRQRLVQRVNSEGYVRSTDLQDSFAVSHMTIQRDLQELEHRGLIKRVRGGARSLETRGIGYGRRERINRLEKEAIGHSAAALANEAESLFIDAGTTCIEVARYLLKRPTLGLNVVTPSVKVASELAGHQGFRLTQLGGDIYEKSFAVAGDTAVKALKKLRVDWAFLGTCGVDLEAGLTNNNHVEVLLKQTAISIAKRSVFLADSSKIGRAALAQISPIDRAHTLITSASLPRSSLKQLKALGWEVITTTS